MLEHADWLSILSVAATIGAPQVGRLAPPEPPAVIRPAGATEGRDRTPTAESDRQRCEIDRTTGGQLS